MGLQQDRRTSLRQLADTGRAQFQDVLRLQDPARLLAANFLVVRGETLRATARPGAARRSLRPLRRATELRERLGSEILPAERGLLPLLAGGAAATAGQTIVMPVPDWGE